MTNAPSPSCFFLGALDDDAAECGLRWFCHRVWPELNRRLPEAQFVITGWNGAGRVQDLSGVPGVIVVENIFDASTHIHQAPIVAFPYRQACTIHDDLLHVLTMRKAVIATPVVLEGLEVQSSVHLRAAHTVSDWIAVTYHLLMHPEVCTRLGAAGRAYVENHHPHALQFRSSVPEPASGKQPVAPQPKLIQEKIDQRV